MTFCGVAVQVGHTTQNLRVGSSILPLPTKNFPFKPKHSKCSKSGRKSRSARDDQTEDQKSARWPPARTFPVSVWVVGILHAIEAAQRPEAPFQSASVIMSGQISRARGDRQAGG